MVWYRDWSIWSGIEAGVGSYLQDKKCWQIWEHAPYTRPYLPMQSLHVSFPRPEPSSRLVPGNETGCIHYLSVSLSLLLKVCQTLKNRARNVRDIARDTLVKMAAALGPRYLPYIIREMKELLTRGYQVSGRNLGGWEGEGWRVRGEG